MDIYIISQMPQLITEMIFSLGLLYDYYTAYN